MSHLTRRVFVCNGALAFMGLGLASVRLAGALNAQSAAAGGRVKTLITIFQRGAMDGLSMLAPFGDPAYRAARGTIAIPAPSRNGAAAIDIDGFFGLHPSLAPLHDLYTERSLAFVTAVGSPHPSRSHFDAQDFMETATPGVKSTPDGWLNRALQHAPCGACRASTDETARAVEAAAGAATDAGQALRGIAIGTAMPRALSGRAPALAVADLERFGVDDSRGGGDALQAFERLYGRGADDIVADAATDAFDAARILEALGRERYRPAAGVQYPSGPFGRGLQQIAQLVKGRVGVEIASIDIGGWDTHRAQGGIQGQLAARFSELARGIRALHDDLGDRMEDVVIMTMTEFGRTVAENGSGGTDHGRASSMIVAGGPVAGGRIVGDWPGLEREQLSEGRDLAVTTDFRDVFAEVASRHLGVTHLEDVFPDHTARFRGVLG